MKFKAYGKSAILIEETDYSRETAGSAFHDLENFYWELFCNSEPKQIKLYETGHLEQSELFWLFVMWAPTRPDR